MVDLFIFLRVKLIYINRDWFAKVYIVKSFSLDIRCYFKSFFYQFSMIALRIWQLVAFEG